MATAKNESWATTEQQNQQQDLSQMVCDWTLRKQCKTSFELCHWIKCFLGEQIGIEQRWWRCAGGKRRSRYWSFHWECRRCKVWIRPVDGIFLHNQRISFNGHILSVFLFIFAIFFSSDFFYYNSPAEASLLQKIIRRGLVESKQDIEVQRADPTSPLYSVKTFEALKLWVNQNIDRIRHLILPVAY